MREDVFNFKITKNLQFAGQFDMPNVMTFQNGLSSDIVALPFNHAISNNNQSKKICHFYLDDYQFERVWNKPALYIPILKKFEAVIGPDFSMYANLPKTQQIYNCWRNKVLMAYWQQCGVNVIPNIQWSDEKSFEWCFDGLSPGGTVAISTSGCHFHNSKKAFMLGFEKMCEVLKPDKIICVGTLFPELKNNAKIIKLNSCMEQRRKLWAEEEANSLSLTTHHKKNS